MRPDPKFVNQTQEFWSVVRLLNQRLGYHERASSKTPQPNFIVPTAQDIVAAFGREGLHHTRLVDQDMLLTKFGQHIMDYYRFRSDLLNNEVEPHLLDATEAEALFNKIKVRVNPPVSLLPMNKQKGAKKNYNFLIGIVNMLIFEGLGGLSFNPDPRELTAITKDNFPVRTLSRRLDGAYPNAIDPVAVWEIKEYYHTTTFGSRIADGVYETMLDGYELEEVRKNLNIHIKHYLFIDAHYTWWKMGKSYLCRMVDIVHMGLVDEVVVGREVETRIPALVAEWMAI